MPTTPTSKLIRQNIRAVKQLWPCVTSLQITVLRELSKDFKLSLIRGDLALLGGKWYVTHSGLIGIARRRNCLGIVTDLEVGVSDPTQQRWVFRATVLTSSSESFVGYGDANPSNISDLVHGAEMRIAETRAVNRALRKAYGIGICSAEEMGTMPNDVGKIPPQRASVNGNGNGSKVRDRLCQLIRQHKLDPALVKAYAVDFCGTKTLRESSREQIEAFIEQLADCAEKDSNALLCHLKSYLPSEQKGVA